METRNIVLKSNIDAMNVCRFSREELESFFSKDDKPISKMKKFVYVLEDDNGKELACIEGKDLVQYTGFTFNEKFTNFLLNILCNELPDIGYFDPLKDEKDSLQESVCGCSTNSDCLGCQC